MTIAQILSTTTHRPYPMPQGAWRFYQEWNRAVFMHWQVQADDVRNLVPEELELDLFEGNAWISAVAFSMEGIRPAYLPALSFVSKFHEINIRTYVKHQGKTGVYFLSIEAGNKFSCLLAQQLSALPYRYSTLTRNDQTYLAENAKLQDHLQLQYKLGDAITQKSKLDVFLTERYALFHKKLKQFYAYDIHHIEWPLRHCEPVSLHINYPRFSKLIGRMPDLMQYSSGVQVLSFERKILVR